MLVKFHFRSINFMHQKTLHHTYVILQFSGVRLYLIISPAKIGLE